MSISSKLAVSLLVVGVGAFGCSDDKKNTDGASGAGGGTTDGAAGAGGAGGRGGTGGGGMGGGGAGGGGMGGGGAGGGRGGTGGGGMGGRGDGGPSDSSRDMTGGETASIWATCEANMLKPNVSAADFCARYMTVCGFGTDPMMRFQNMGQCMTRYTSYMDTTGLPQRACAAYHLCAAGQPPMSNVALHCPHPAQVGGPCMLPM